MRCADPGLEAISLDLWILLQVLAGQRLRLEAWHSQLAILDPLDYPQHLFPWLETSSAVLCINLNVSLQS